MKKKRKQIKLNSPFATKLLIFSLLVLLVGISSIVSYKKGYSDSHALETETQKKVEVEQTKLLAKIKDIATPNKDLVSRLQDVLSKEQKKSDVSAKNKPKKVALEKDTLGRPPKIPIASSKSKTTAKAVQKKKIYNSKPKLAIIMDDVSFAHDVASIKALKMRITMSFLPPSPIHPDSAKLASREALYMVHLPLEAMTFSAEEPTTLHVSDSKYIINQRVKEMKKLFPRAYFVNNHTGSKFTSNKRAINDLIVALNNEGIGFLDSRTTAETKVPEVMASLGKPYLARDLFLDHKADVSYIEKQILKAISKAKKNGSAIAICHPRPHTLQALKNSRKVLENVELVLVNKII